MHLHICTYAPFLFCAFFPAPAAADYRVDSTAWDGLSALAAIASDGGCPVTSARSIEWNRLTGTDVLWLVYPTTPIDVAQLEGFLRAGGRVVIADDFGSAAPVFTRLGITRHESPVPDALAFHGRAQMPVASPTGKTTLAGATRALVTNHPAWLSGGPPPSYEFSPGAAAVIEGVWDGGSFVALSDPSVLINNMLELPEDRLFAAALVASTCRPGVDRILLVTGDALEHGSSPTELVGAPVRARGPIGDRVESALHDLNEALHELGSRLVLGLCAVGLALALLLRSLPSAPPTSAPRWTRATSTHEPSGYEAMVRRYARGELPAGETLLAAVLRAETLARLAARIGPIEGDDERPRAIAARVTAAFDRETGKLAARLIARLRSVSDNLGLLSARRLARLHDDARELFRRLDA